jgi:hypothetical protein
MTELTGRPAYVRGPRSLGRKPTDAAPGTQGAPKTPWQTTYTDANGHVQGVALGADNTVLKSTGAASAPEWAVVSPSELVGTNWRVFYTNGSGTVIQMALGAAGTVLSSTGPTSAPSFVVPSTVRRVLKTSNETVAGSTTLQNDNELALAVATGEQLVGYFVLLVTGAEADDLKFDLALPASTVFDYTAMKTPTGATGTAPYAPELGVRRNASSATETAGTLGTTANSEETMVVIWFSITTLVGSGTCLLRWAQNVAGGTTTVLAGSHAVAFKV